MNRDNLTSEFLALERKLKMLLSEHKALKDEVKYLKNENEELRSSMKLKDEHLNNFQNKFKISKLVSNLAVDQEDTVELKQVINEYIKEIDMCIAHLSE
ncbi:hypothetical protein QQ008_05410 [Fulvivirgaceae bacterium BMA10]|uniref:Uncharacterized protein n=1 Tax=Splendidivirga corallicola TaxID=3051826 RepID=A0ABT8KKN1_9BACT|nr:hypothetical protein [Fulvivirgaceae bacterium BMA10]